MVRMKFISGVKEEDAIKQTGWIDEELESDGVDLEEWAFWRGYNEEE